VKSQDHEGGNAPQDVQKRVSGRELRTEMGSR